MRRLTPLFLSGIVALGACTDGSTPVAPEAATASFSEAAGTDTYLVRFQGNGVPADFSARIAALGGEVIFAHPVGVAAVGGLTAERAGQLAAQGDIAGVDVDAWTELDPAPAAEAEAVVSEELESPSNPAGAVRFARQWNMQVINAPQAWAAGKKGISTVRVGILDTGIDYNHPDLAGRVDLAASRSFLSAAENKRVTDTFGPNTHLVADLNYHGTHVAATVASNAYIAAGVTSGVKLVGLKVCSPGTAANGFRGSCPTSGTLAAILYSADIGLPVINMSLGGSFNRRDASAQGGNGPSFLATINQVLTYANRKGTLVVVSAGNSAIDMDHDGNSFKSYCSAPAVVCVSATGPTSASTVNGPWANIDALASYSNFGRSAISVAAPGGNGVAVTAACSGFTVVTSLLVCRNRFYNSPTSWSGFVVGLSGTSMASPHVAGVAALIASDGVSGPAQIRARLQNSADDLGEPGVDPAYGKGRINAARAVGL
jgi:subtilisin family serine protease